MLTKQIGVKEANGRLQKMLSQFASGVERVLTDTMKPVARLVPISERVAGLYAGASWTSQNFSEPLSEEFLTGRA
jgi:antitoxin (DNA-binding transcriptional repressor) of toxin-antitoxin stability system